MPRPRKITSSYTKHKQSGRGRLIWTDTAGVRHEKLMPGAYGSEDSLAAKARLVLELATSPTRNVVDSKDITVAELMAAYISYAARYYVDAEGKPTKELENMKVATKPGRTDHLPATTSRSSRSVTGPTRTAGRSGSRRTRRRSAGGRSASTR